MHVTLYHSFAGSMTQKKRAYKICWKNITKVTTKVNEMSERKAIDETTKIHKHEYKYSYIHINKSQDIL